MPSSNICWGIEVGAYAIKALKLEQTADGPKVVDFAIVPHKKVLSTPGLDQNDAIRVALGEFVAQYDVGKAVVAMSVPGHQAFARFAKLPPVEPKKVPDIVKFEAVQQIPFPIEQVEWDYQTFASPDSPEVEVGIFAITREKVMEKLTLYEDVDIVPNIVTLSPVAAYNALAYDLAFTETTPGTVILDIGTTSTDLVVADAGRVWIRTFPIGGHHFTEALVNAFQLTYPKAEKLKREADSSKHARHIFQALRPVFSDLAQDVQRSIGFYQSSHSGSNLQRLIGIGSTFRLPGIRKFLKQQLQLDVYRLEQFKRLSLDGPRAGEFQAETLNLATAYGLALQGLNNAALVANLMPTSVVRTSMWKGKVKWFGIAAGVAGAAALAMFYRPFIDSQAVAANPKPREVDAVLAQVSQLKSEAGEVTAAAAADPKVEELMKLLDKRDIYGHIVRDVGLMVADATDKASKLPAPSSGPKPTAPALAIKDLKTTFVPSAEGQASDQPPADPNAAAAPVGPKVQIELTVETGQPEGLRFLTASAEAWLRANVKRSDVPYQLVVTGRPVVITSVVDISTTGEATAAALPQPGDSAGGAAATAIPAATGRGGRMTGRGGGGDGGAPPDRDDRSIVGGSGPAPNWQDPPQQGTAPDQNQTAAMEAVRKAAPLPGEPAPVPGSRRTIATIKWDAVIVPKPKPVEGQPPDAAADPNAPAGAPVGAPKQGGSQ